MPEMFPSYKLPVCRGGGTKRKDKRFKKGWAGGPGRTPTSTEC